MLFSPCKNACSLACSMVPFCKLVLAALSRRCGLELFARKQWCLWTPCVHDKHSYTATKAPSQGQQVTLETDLLQHACGPCGTSAGALHVPQLPHINALCHCSTQLKPSMADCRSAEVSEAVCFEEASHFARMLFYQRLRTPADRQQVAALFESVWGTCIKADTTPELSISPHWAQVGKAGLARPGATHSNSGDPVALISCRLGRRMSVACSCKHGTPGCLCALAIHWYLCSAVWH